MLDLDGVFYPDTKDSNHQSSERFSSVQFVEGVHLGDWGKSPQKGLSLKRKDPKE